MKLKKNVIWLVVVLAVGIYFSPGIKDRSASAGVKPEVNGVAPAFSLSGLNVRGVRLSDFKGKVVLVNFWANWCPPCKMEIPGFENAYKAYKNNGFAVIGIAMDDVPPSFIREMGITYPLAMADDKVVHDYGNISGMPTSFLIGRDGRVVKKVVGIYFESVLMQDLQNALGKKG
jgi:thiol-disulfide isomerase/thioredoxin